MIEWKHIETAPKDGTSILLGCRMADGEGYEIVAARWHFRFMGRRWTINGTEEGLHFSVPLAWAPLPSFDGSSFERTNEI